MSYVRSQETSVLSIRDLGIVQIRSVHVGVGNGQNENRNTLVWLIDTTCRDKIP